MKNVLADAERRLKAIVGKDAVDAKQGLAVLDALLESDALTPVQRRTVASRKRRVLARLAAKPSATRGVGYYVRFELSAVRKLLLAVVSTAPAPTARVDTVSATVADREAGGRWFRGATKTVVVETATAIDGDFDEAARTGGGSEYVLFRNGLRVGGTLRLAKDSRSIYVVVGELVAGAIELGDSVLVVTQKARARRYVFSPHTEGVFSIGGKPGLAAVVAPTVVSFDGPGASCTQRTKGTSTQKRVGASVALAALRAGRRLR